MWKWIDGFLDRLAALSGAILFSQWPAFMEQYVQNLSGRVAELQIQVDQLNSLAASFHKTVPEYVNKFLNSQDPEFRAQGIVLQSLTDRFSYLQTSLQTISSAPVWQKPFSFLTTFQWDVAKNAYKQFSPAFSLTLEGIVFAFVGLCVGVSLYRVVRSVFKVRRHDHVKTT